MDADSSKRPDLLKHASDEPVSTTRLATIEVDTDVDDDAPTQRMAHHALEPAEDPSARPTLQSPLPSPFWSNPTDEHGPEPLYPIELAAPRLHMTPRNLRSAFRRKARSLRIDLRVDTIVDLGGGVVGHKVSSRWFVRLPRR
jgi:hypothetical protein